MTASVSSDSSNRRRVRGSDNRLLLVDREPPASRAAPVVWDWSLVAIIALVLAVLVSIVLI